MSKHIPTFNGWRNSRQRVNYVEGSLSMNTVLFCFLRSLFLVESVALRMIAPILFFLLCATLAESSYEDDLCITMNGSPGVYTFMKDCQSLGQETVAENSADTSCEDSEFEPIVCCPTTTSFSAETTLQDPIEDWVEDVRGAIAKKKCAEYSQSVYTLNYPPTLYPNRPPVNVSLCAIKSQKLIIGGTKAERKEFPHMAAVGFTMKNGETVWSCGGTLISESFTLTAAHCTFSLDWGDASWVRVGDLNLMRSDDGATPVDRRITHRIRHPQYKRPSQYHDIALLRLESRVPFNGWIRPACLHTAPTTGTTKAIATGWGLVKWDDEKGSNDLLKVTLPIVDTETCNASYTSDTAVNRLPNGIVGDWMICAGEFDKDSCKGDSGGPLVIFSKKEYHCMYDVVGVMSLGRTCGSAVPGFYTRVYNYIPWIESIVWPQG